MARNELSRVALAIEMQFAGKQFIDGALAKRTAKEREHKRRRAIAAALEFEV